MTRDEAIERWSHIANTVFWAENNISEAWDARLRAAPGMTKEEQHELAQAYCRAIAVEITKDTSDEQLAEME